MLPLTVMAAGNEPDASDATLPQAAAVAMQWRPDPESLDVWRYSANFLFTLEIDGTPFFLRVAPGSERTRDRLEQEVDLLAWLHAHGWRVPLAQPTRDGLRVATHEAGDQRYHAVLWSVAPGEIREVDDLSLADLAVWGASLGRLHATFSRRPAGLGPDRVAWRAERDLILAALPAWSPAVQEAAAHSLAWIAAQPTAGPGYGLIHGDFELDNLPWAEGGPGVIDFDEAGISWLAADLAFAVRDLVRAGETVTTPRLGAFLAGYATEHPLPEDLASVLPQFSQWARLVTLARIYRARPDDAPSLPGWAQDLDHRLGELAVNHEAGILAAAPLLTAHSPL